MLLVCVNYPAGLGTWGAFEFPKKLQLYTKIIGAHKYNTRIGIISNSMMRSRIIRISYSNLGYYIIDFISNSVISQQVYMLSYRSSEISSYD